MDNLSIIEYKKKLTKAVETIGNESGLPVIVQSMCMAEILNQLNAIVQNCVQMEQEQAQKEGDKVG
ncbi:hypothetical protein [Clostridium sp. KNHs205]|uniref:hypothetical protein n=1 Tax=Clostridium sp. KNHs205 TaxID=1449050 RepID=UPI00051BE942|nr:hypothetical protein [Clostridium sp. KNHs205]